MENMNEFILLAIVCEGNIAFDFNGIDDYMEFIPSKRTIIMDVDTIQKSSDI